MGQSPKDTAAKVEAKVDLLALRAAPLDAGEAIVHVSCAEAGGIDVFIGTTRAELHPELGVLVALDYDAYPEMALHQIGQIVAAARQRWPIARVAVLHRLGRCAVGEPSVVIAVACRHRGEAFEACRYVIDELKNRVPIWKKDVYVGMGRWRHDTDKPGEGT